MACNASKTAFIRAMAKRAFSAQASPCPVRKTEIKSASLPNKLIVATSTSRLPVTRISVVFRAGSRHEDYENLGASNYLNIAVGLSTNNASGFSIMRNIGQIGGTITAINDRELVTITVECTVDKIETALKYLDAAVTSPAFKPWELQDTIPRIRNIRSDSSASSLMEKTIDKVHKAAYRVTLGNSIYCPKHQIGKLSSESLLHYFRQNCTAERAAVIGTGIEQNVLQGFAQNLELDSGAGKTTPSKFHGGDCRKDKSGDRASIAIVAEGGSLCSLKEALTFAVLAQAWGAGESTKRGNINGALGQAIARGVGDRYATYSSYNASYSDSGLFGATMTVDARVAGKAIEGVASVLKSGRVTDEEFKRGKSLMQTKIAEVSDSSLKASRYLAKQACITGDIVSPSDMLSMLDSISKTDVDSAASKVGKSKLAIGAIGNLINVPYASDLA